ncbi:hypothetical protein Mapa_017792 [Marchantia paleacea]|nr:hypothetical protein Mapa_017792 [Marchantia paleacea]
MKGGVTCLGGMFCRRNKVKQRAIIDDAIVAKKGSHDNMVSDGTSYKEYTVSFFSGGKDGIITVANDVIAFRSQGNVHHVSEGQAHVCADSDDIIASVETVPAANAAVDVESQFTHKFVATTATAVAADSSCPKAMTRCNSMADELESSNTKPVTRSSSANGLGDAEYEGEDEDEDEEDVTGASARGARNFTDGRSEPIRIEDYSSSHAEVLDNDCARYYDEFSTSGGGPGSIRRDEHSFGDLEMASGHVSDPGVYPKCLASSCSSPMLNGCEAAEKQKQQNLAGDGDRDRRNQDNISVLSGPQTPGLSYESGSSTTGEVRDGACLAPGGSPNSEAAYQYNAEHAIFKFGVSSEALEAHKRKPWWKVFLVSHRNIHRETRGDALGPLTEGDAGRSLSPLNGYVSDVEDRSGRSSPSNKNEGVSDGDNGGGSEKVGTLLRNSFSEQDLYRQSSGGGHESTSGGDVGLVSTPEKGKPSITARRWDAFTEKTGLSRVEEWVSNVHPLAPTLDEDQMETQGGEIVPESPTAPAAAFFTQLGEESPFNDQEEKHGIVRGEGVLDADAEMARRVVRSVNPLSTVAHFSGVGLKVIPSLGIFSSLKTLNLSANSFVRITPGCLPKSLHTLDLSRNQIVVIEGLRELTRLRALNLSFNRITRIGNGLSNCMSLKELYLSGNKISELEGLHRLSKLSVLDLSFNKVTTTKSLGQLAANYKSLQALNLLGNPVQSNLGDDHMRRMITGVCPQILYLNKQPLKTVSNRDAVDNNVARAALGKSAGGKALAKPSKRAAGHSSTSNHRRSHSGGGGSKIKPASKGVVSPVLVSQDPGHHRKSHHSRLPDKVSTSKEARKGFVPLPESAYPPLVDRKGRPVERMEFTTMPRVRSDDALFREHRQSVPSAQDLGNSSKLNDFVTFDKYDKVLVGQ